MPITFKSSGKITSPNNVETKSDHHKTIFSNTNIYKQKAAGDIVVSSIDTRQSKRQGLPPCPNVYKADSVCAAQSELVYKSMFNNGLIGGVLEAYNNHHNLILRPDDIWLAIMSQFAVYVDKNGEELRSKFVSHEGKIKVEARDIGNRYSVNYPMLVNDLINQCGKYLKDDNIKDWILPNFTTTTDNDRTVGTMVMMSAFQSYFSYKICCMCGIPNITLLGEPSDWEEIRRRVNDLSLYNITRSNRKEMDKELSGAIDQSVSNDSLYCGSQLSIVPNEGKYGIMTLWKMMLIPILDKFVAASKGNIDLSFWERIVSYIRGGSGPSYLSGWITAFTCFSSEGNWCGDRHRKVMHGKGIDNSPWPLVDTSEINIGFTSVPFDLDDNGVEFKAMFFSGHMFHDVVDGNTIQPRLDWVMTLVDEDKINAAKKPDFNSSIGDYMRAKGR